MKADQIERLGIIGAGLMGHSLAQYFAAQGLRVQLYDAQAEVLASVEERIRRNFDVFIDLGLARPEEVSPCLARIRLCPELAAACLGADFIIEAVSENLDLKHALFKQMESLVPAETILSSNTSAISISLIAEPLRHKGRVLGTHFWNPPHVVPGVEVIRSPDTTSETFETIYAFLKRTGKRPVRVLKDVPGFIGNRMQHALWREAISIVERGIASPQDVDEVVKSGFGLRMPFLGPLETADLAGLDLTWDIHQDLLAHLESSGRPSPALKERVAAGALGAKTGRGFHDWPEEKLKSLLQARDRVLLQIAALTRDLDGRAKTGRP